MCARAREPDAMRTARYPPLRLLTFLTSSALQDCLFRITEQNFSHFSVCNLQDVPGGTSIFVFVSWIACAEARFARTSKELVHF